MAAQAPATTTRRSAGMGEPLGQYRRLESIGKGSFAVVYKGIHPDGSLVAIKSVQVTQLKGKLKANLFSEIDILKSIQHPHIVALVNCLESTNHIHLIMEFCQLGDLATFVRKRDKLAAHPVTADMIRKYPNPPGAGFHEVVVRHFSKQLAAALEFLRSKDFVHRDLKPQNLLLNPPPAWIANEKPENRPYEVFKDSVIPLAGLENLPTLKIADFGFARHLPQATMAETLCGSPLYMAPEILRYERYDAKADLWSVGTVLYELVAGKPPFRAANHVDLLRRIERANDIIKFPEECYISSDMQEVIRALLKKQPTERMGWEGFFRSAINVNEIPGLALSDRPKQIEVPKVEEIQPTLPDAPQHSSLRPIESGDRTINAVSDKRTSPSPRSTPTPSASQPASSHQTRPILATHVTAPAAEALRENKPLAERRRSGIPNPPAPPSPKENVNADMLVRRRQESVAKNAREKAAQDIAFERDYVMVEKRAVEVNAFADELAASPQIHGAQHSSTAPQPGALARRATTQGRPTSLTGALPDYSNKQIAIRPEQYQARKTSWDLKSAQNRISATSAIAAALQGVNQRLYGTPLYGYLARGVSPPQPYGPFPAFPASNGLSPPLGEPLKTANQNEEQRLLGTIEECATRSDVVYGFAEVKYKQLIPITPSSDNVLGMRRQKVVVEDDPEDDLTADAIIEISEEALVLYVKTLGILTNTFNLAARWWSIKNRGMVIGEVPSFARSLDSDKASPTSSSIGLRVNNVVQWARNRFNECLEKSEYVTLRLSHAQTRLPRSHPGHPSNHASQSEDAGSQGISSTIHLSSGITAEKLMYERAVEMSKTAALNELTNEDLPGCEVAYLTAVRLLEAVLESEDDTQSRKGGSARKAKTAADADIAATASDIEEGDRKTVEKLIEGTKLRLGTLRKKIVMRTAAKRTSLRAPSYSGETQQQLLGRTPPRTPASLPR